MTMKRRRDKVWHILTTEYYPVIKSGEVLIHATTQINFENGMLRKLCQT